MRLYLHICCFAILVLLFCPASEAADDYRWIAEPRFDAADSFSEGMASVKIDGKSGYINTSGDIVIEPQFDEAGAFSGGTAPVVINGMRSYINRKGVQTVVLKEDDRLYFGEALAVIKVQGRYGYMKMKGGMALRPVYDDAGSFSEGVAPVKVNGMYGFIDRGGHMVIKPVYEKALIFCEGLAAAKSGGKWGYIKRNGMFAVKPVFQAAGNFSGGITAVKTDSGYGFIKKDGKFIITPQFEDALPFSENIAAVKLNGRWGYITPARKSLKVESYAVKIGGGSSKSVKDEVVKTGITGKIKESSEPASIETKKDDSSAVKKETNTVLTDTAGVAGYNGDVSGERLDKKIPAVRGMEYAGVVSEVNEGQVVIREHSTGAKVYLGAWCIVSVDGDKVFLDSGTPIATVAKCESRNGILEKIRPGMKVYKKIK